MEEHNPSNIALDETESKSYLSITPRQERWIVMLVLAAFVALAIGFSLGPILEGQDEVLHYRFVRVLADTWQLPNQMITHSEFQQPPLYYYLAALIKKPIADSDFDELLARPNPGGTFTALFRLPNWQVQPSNDTTARLVHSRAEDFPYQSGTARAVHLVRLLSVALGVGTVITCYGILQMLWPDRPDCRLLGLGIIAFWPLFNYLSGYVTNDTLLIFLSNLTLYLTMRQVQYGPSFRQAIVLGVVLGGALLSKANALLLIAPVGLALLLDWRRAWRFGLIVFVTTVTISGWWYARSAMVYGDPTGLIVQYKVNPGAYMPIGTLSFVDSLAVMGRIYMRLWARFGWMYNVVVSPSIYIFFDTLTVAGVTGAILSSIRWFRQSRSQPVDPIWLHMVSVIIIMGLGTLSAVYVFSVTNSGGVATARYLLPAICVWGSLFACGLGFWIPHHLKIPVTLFVVTVLAVVATTCLLKYFLPAYKPLPLPSKIEHSLAIQYEDAAELIGVGASTVYAKPGEIITITLYWRAIQPTEHDLFTFVQVGNGRIPLLLDVPATGHLRSTEWQPGQTWAECWQVYIPPDAPPQTVYPVIVGLSDPTENRQLDIVGRDVWEVGSTVIEVVVAAH
ncbi:MAG: glycosyltransferase family 39 protein [Anaerolineae bacterium]|nr:glycosyltransferase family 39 protein [Anaerolineae bacterium]